MAVILNASTSTGYVQTADTSGDLVIQSNGTTQFNVTSTGAYGQIKSGTAVSPTVSTSVEFTNLPSWVKRITVMLNGVSTNSTGIPLVQLGDSGGYETTGYSAMTSFVSTTSNTTRGTTSTSGFPLQYQGGAAETYSGSLIFSLLSSNTWTCTGSTFNANSAAVNAVSGVKTLSDTLTSIRLFIDGTQQFDAGSINILYEG